jgi:hypothetical protein
LNHIVKLYTRFFVWLKAVPDTGDEQLSSTTGKHSFRQVFRYRFDNFMARGGSSIFISLVVVFVGLLVVIGILRGLAFLLLPSEASQHGRNFFHIVYITFLQLTDPGNMAQDIETSPWFKLFPVVAGLSGALMFSALIAFITTALDQKLNELKKGHSKVIENSHTLILGWNNQRVVEILRELIIANESEEAPCVVILSEVDKEAMDDHLSIHLPDTENTRVVTRSGAISSLVNMEIVSVDTCKSIIVLAECNESGSADQKAVSDAKVIKTVLATAVSRPEGKQYNIVADIFDPLNREIVQGILPGEVTTVDACDILAKVIVQTSRSIGLSMVYNEILSFDGCEMYFHHADWGDITFEELGYHFPDGVPLGLRRADGKLMLNPPVNTKLAPDDDILILAEDDSSIEFRSEPVARPRDLPLADGRQEPKIERELIIGWTPKARVIIEQYSDYVLEGSTIDIMLRSPSETVRLEIEEIQEQLPGIKLTLIEKDPLKMTNLLSVEPFHYDNIIILSQGSHETDAERTDAETIIILLLLRNIFDAHAKGNTRTKLITEVLDSRNRELVARAGVNDLIISNQLISMILAQVSEEQDIKLVYDDLFQEAGSEIYVKPASLYFTSFPIQVTFADMIRIVHKRQEVCLGVKIKEQEKDLNQNFGIQLIPEKNTKYTLYAEDALVVLAEDET